MRLAGLLLSLLLALLAEPALAGDVLIPTDKVQGGSGGRFFTLAIGVSHFRDAFWPTLRWPTEDARKVASALGQGTDLKPDTTLLLDADATRDRVVKALKDIRARATSRDTVVVYVSTHGTLAVDDDGDLEKVVVLADTTEDHPLATGLAHKDLSAWLDALPARRKLLVFATCHGGVGKSRLSPRVERLLGKGGVAPLADVSEGSLILAAAAKGEAAREDDKLQGDVYTHYFLEGLTTNDRNHDGVVTALEAHDYAKEKTYSYTGGRQRPTADARLIGDADVPLRGVRKRRGLPVLEAYENDLAGFQVRVDDGVKGRLPSAFPLDPDGSVVAVYAPESGRKIGEYQVAATPGSVVTLADVLAPPPYDLGLAVGQDTWVDPAFRTLAGRLDMTYTELQGRYHWAVGAAGDLEGGLTYRLKRKGSAAPRPALAASVSYDAYLASFGYGWRFGGAWRLAGEGTVGQENVQVKLADDGGGHELGFDSRALLYGARVALGHDLGPRFEARFEAGRLWGHDEFATLGALDAGRTLLGIGVAYHFGGVARKL